MNASEKQNNDSLAGAPKVRSSKPAASKPAAKSIARANKPKHAKAIKKPKGRSKTPAATRRGTKTAKILALLRRPAGASLSELKKATGWQAHSVRGFLSGAVKKKMGLRIDSAPRDHGERAYRVASK